MSERAAFKPIPTLERVRTRLELRGCATELGHLDGLSDFELDVLVRLEHGWGPQTCENPARPAAPGRSSTDSSTVLTPQSTGKTQGCATSTPQAGRRTIAA